MLTGSINFKTSLTQPNTYTPAVTQLVLSTRFDRTAAEHNAHLSHVPAVTTAVSLRFQIQTFVNVMFRGQIPAQFKLLPFESPYASKFSFRPREGTLNVGEAKTIRVQLQSDLLGTFSDTFSWSLNGSSEALKLQFKGSIVGPKYSVS